MAEQNRRNTVTFLVTRALVDASEEAGKRTEYLTREGDWTSAAEKAASFTFYTTRRVREKTQIERLAHDIAGGVDIWRDLEREAAYWRAIVVKQIEAILWPTETFPGGRPPAQGRALAAQLEAIESAWTDHTSREMDAYASLYDVMERIGFLATWSVLWVTGPDTLRNLADTELDEPTIYACQSAHLAALAEAESGKGKPSES